MVRFQAYTRLGQVVEYNLDDAETLGGAASVVARGGVPENVLQAMMSRARLQQAG